jgi:CO dehydrogenase maturation factor
MHASNNEATDLSDQVWPLQGKRILVCGKGGSGKSTFVALIAAALQRRDYQVMVLDGDASNPEGLIRLLFGMGIEGEPKPLIDFFGGIARVTCPVDDPSPLTRCGDTQPIPQQPIDLFCEIPHDFYLRRGALTFLQVGKIRHYGEGCDGPAEKVVRDFLIQGKAVSLIDMKAGIEHFGRRIPDRMDVILVVLDYTLESVSIATRVAEFCDEANIHGYWLVLNKIGSSDVESKVLEKLGALRERVLGIIAFDPQLIVMGLSGQALGECAALDSAEQVVKGLEQQLRSTEINQLQALPELSRQ